MSRACINSACNYCCCCCCCCCWAPSRLERKSPKISPTLQQILQKWGINYDPPWRNFTSDNTENWKSPPPFLKTVEGHESTAKFGSKLCATGVVKEWASERGMMVGATNRSLGNIRSCHLYDAACTRVTTCKCTTVHSRLTWSFYFILFIYLFIIIIIILWWVFSLGEGSFLM